MNRSLFIPRIYTSISLLSLALLTTLTAKAQPSLMPASSESLQVRDATAELVEVDGESALKMEFGPSEKYSNVFIQAPDGVWDLSQYAGIEAVVTNQSDEMLKFGMRVDNNRPKNERAWNQTGARIQPGETATVRVTFGMDYGKPGFQLDPASVESVLFFMGKSPKSSAVLLKSLKPWGTASEQVNIDDLKGTAPQSSILFDFKGANPLQGVKGLDSTYEVEEYEGKPALKFTLGHNNPYPNVSFTPSEPLDLSAYESIEFDIVNLNDESVGIGARVDNPNATGRSNSNSGSVTLDPGQSGTLTVKFYRTYAEDIKSQLKGLDYTPWGPRGRRGSSINPAYIVRMNVFMNKPHQDHSFVITAVRAAGKFDPDSLSKPEPFFPYVDKYGQYIHQDWPDKIHSDEDFAAIRAREEKSMNDFPKPEDWDKYGGWATGPQLEATGNFYTTRWNDAWYLVDPEGHLFFSLGMDVIQARGSTFIGEETGREGWFADEPWLNEPEMAQYKSTGKSVRGDYGGVEATTFEFYSANLHRKYGPDWRQTWLEVTPHRLMNWGFNTIGNWSDPELLQQAQIPYTHWVHYWPPSKMGGPKPVPDPFDPNFYEAVRKRAETMTRGTTDDPYCIGYFVDNELSWGDETEMARQALAAGAKMYAKQALVESLQAQYSDIAALNTAWGTDIASWDALLKKPVKDVPDTQQAKADLLAFNEKLLSTYFEKVRDAVKSVAPDKLYLGCRFADNNPLVVKVAAEYCDVVSFNIYRGSVASWKPPYAIDKPVIIGEYHFGATDRGVFGPGLRGAKTTERRVEMYRNYIDGAIKNPIFVGAHWFQLMDEPVSGRTLEGENHGIGFLTITDTPYQVMIDASRDAANSLYDMRSNPTKLTLNQ